MPQVQLTDFALLNKTEQPSRKTVVVNPRPPHRHKCTSSQTYIHRYTSHTHCKRNIGPHRLPYFPGGRGFLQPHFQPTQAGVLKCCSSLKLAMTFDSTDRGLSSQYCSYQLSGCQPLAPENVAYASNWQKHQWGTQFGNQDLAKLCLLPKQGSCPLSHGYVSRRRW